MDGYTLFITPPLRCFWLILSSNPEIMYNNGLKWILGLFWVFFGLVLNGQQGKNYLVFHGGAEEIEGSSIELVIQGNHYLVDLGAWYGSEMDAAYSYRLLPDLLRRADVMLVFVGYQNPQLVGGKVLKGASQI